MMKVEESWRSSHRLKSRGRFYGGIQTVSYLSQIKAMRAPSQSCLMRLGLNNFAKKLRTQKRALFFMQRTIVPLLIA